MDNLEKFNSEKLNTFEMKEVQGGNWVDDLVKVVDAVVPTVVSVVTKITG